MAIPRVSWAAILVAVAKSVRVAVLDMATAADQVAPPSVDLEIMLAGARGGDPVPRQVDGPVGPDGHAGGQAREEPVRAARS